MDTKLVPPYREDAESFYAIGVNALKRGRLKTAVQNLSRARSIIELDAISTGDYLLLSQILRSLGGVWAMYYDLLWYKKDSNEIISTSSAREKADQYYSASREALTVSLNYGLEAATYFLESAVISSNTGLMHFHAATRAPDQETILKDAPAALLEMHEAYLALRGSNSAYELDHLIRTMYVLKFRSRKLYRKRLLELTAPGSVGARERNAVRVALLLGGRMMQPSLCTLVDESKR